MSQNPDAQVIQSALGTHLGYLRAAESAHRSAGRALAAHPELPELVRSRVSPIAVSAAHRARSASFGQRAEFVEQLLDFPASGLRVLAEGDMRSLQVPAHIGQAALPQPVAQGISEREARARLAAARPAARPATDRDSVLSAAGDAPAVPQEQPAPAEQKQDNFAAEPRQKKAPWHKRSFNDILLGRK
ncbi:hypothetical protein [Nesterenkonia ebinurensis]|uniref:hypothetical protein n=1 Tax=Nesterenkonia ebinurensis TaxID=2608252 RepID=UPI00123E1EB2|nr:hypothetical protein [Nesterenkonia ebinurensis]